MGTVIATLMKNSIYLVRFVLAITLVGGSLYYLISQVRDNKSIKLSRRGVAVLVAALLLVAVTTLIVFPIASERLFPPRQLTTLGNNSVYEMDTNRVVDTYTSSRGCYRTNVHPLQSLFYNPFAVELMKQYGFNPVTASQFLCLASQLICVGIICLIVWLNTGSAACTTLSAVLFVSSYSFWLSSFIPESAPIAAPCILLPFLVLSIYRSDKITTREFKSHIVAGIMTLSVTITNPLHSAVVYLARCWETGLRGKAIAKRFVIFALTIAAIGIVLSCIQFAAFGGGGLWFLPQSVISEHQYTHIGSLISPLDWLDTARQMFLYTMIGPYKTQVINVHFLPMITAHQLTLLPTSLPYAAATIWIALIFIWSLIRIRSTLIGKSIIAALLLQLLLHIVYGRDYLLYSGNWFSLLPVVIAIAASHLRNRWSYALFLPLPLMVFCSLSGIAHLSSSIKEQAQLIDTRYFVGTPLKDELNYIVVGYDGSISPGIGTYGLRVAAVDLQSAQSNLDALVSMKASRTLEEGYLPFPTISTDAGHYKIRQTVYPLGDRLAILKVRIACASHISGGKVRLMMLLSNAGPAGSTVTNSHTFSWSKGTNEFYVDRHPAIACGNNPTGVIPLNGGPDAFDAATVGSLKASKNTGIASNMIAWWDVNVTDKHPYEEYFTCFIPRKPHCSVIGSSECIDPLDWNASKAIISVSQERLAKGVAASVRAANTQLSGFDIKCPDPEWQQIMKASASAIALNVQEGGRLVVSPVNYNVFVRDAVYAVNTLIMTGQYALADQSISYLLKNPWEGRPYPEGDAPGQLLWLISQYWRYTGDLEWLIHHKNEIIRIKSAAEQTITRGTKSFAVDLMGNKGYLDADSSLARSVGFRLLNYGKMDGCGSIYCSIFTAIGLSRSAEMLSQLGLRLDAENANRSSKELVANIDASIPLIGGYSADNRAQYCALWPCRYHELSGTALSAYRQYVHIHQTGSIEKIRTLMKSICSSSNSRWPYLELDNEHNKLIAKGHYNHSSILQDYSHSILMRTWRTLDEGGPSQSGYWWSVLKLSSDASVAMPHAWSLASLFSLMRDSIAREDRGKVILMSGTPEEWFNPGKSMSFKLPTEYGLLKFTIKTNRNTAVISIRGTCKPPLGYMIYLPTKKGWHAMPMSGNNGTWTAHYDSLKI